VGNLNTVKLNQRRFAPTPAHIAGIKCPHHWNTQVPRSPLPIRLRREPVNGGGL
jgi:hypothetical protein